VANQVAAEIEIDIIIVVVGIRIFRDRLVLAMESSKAVMTIASLLDIFSTGSMIGAKELSLQSFTLCGMRTKMGRWKLAVFSRIQVGIIKGRRAIAMELRFESSIFLYNSGFHALSTIKAFTVVATGWLQRVLFCEGVEFTTASSPTLGTITASFRIVTTDTRMDTKRDSGQCVTIIRMVTKRCRLVLTRRTGVEVGFVVGFGTIAHHLESLCSILQRKILFLTHATIDTIKATAFFGGSVVMVGFVSVGLCVFALESGESVGTVAALCGVILAFSSIDTKQIVIVNGAIFGGLVLAKLTGKPILPIGGCCTIAMKFRLFQTIFGGNRRGYTGTSMITLIFSTFVGCRFAEGPSKIRRTKTPHVVIDFVGTPHAM
jgi:hypothetical protein